MRSADDPHRDPMGKPAPKPGTLIAVLATGVFFVALAFLAGVKLNAPPLASLSFTINAFLAGIAATVPLVLLLWWFMRTKAGPFPEFRRSQIAYFEKIGFEFTPLAIVLLSLSAGIGEELLFRGALQAWITAERGVVIAIIATNIVFGALHWRGPLYAIIAGGVGAYLGVVFAVTGNILVPIIAHFLYDIIALTVTRRAIDAYRRGEPL